MACVSSQGIKWRFEDPDAGGEDAVQYTEVALNFLLLPGEWEKQGLAATPAVEHRPWKEGGSEFLSLLLVKLRRWVDTLTRKRYLELEDHVIEVDRSLPVAIHVPQGNNVDAMDALPVTLTATNTDTTYTESNLTGGESDGITMFSSSSRNRSALPESARKRKIPYRKPQPGSHQ
ncbi:hypothetical protein FRC01_010632 [Tulasnella sp. 417]|nr:hypothetical protein FRC01_010632 [Tulasnella sp. 417]